MLECDYPAYFNTETNACDDDFENVDCGNRTRHIDACKYLDAVKPGNFEHLSFEILDNSN